MVIFRGKFDTWHSEILRISYYKRRKYYYKCSAVCTLDIKKTSGKIRDVVYKGYLEVIKDIDMTKQFAYEILRLFVIYITPVCKQAIKTLSNDKVWKRDNIIYVCMNRNNNILICFVIVIYATHDTFSLHSSRFIGL